MPRSSARTARLEARISPDALAFVKRAAEIQGRSISDFVVAAAQDAAKRTIEETSILRLSLADQEKVAEVLLNPPPMNDALEQAFEAHRRLIRSSK